ncbi:apocarotenoid-15,15'-oxygenase [Parvularcula sp. ZS-1/3]|uniref:Dioxygenase n=1 Tax=Parvularcula mediterranea TaxID=2732508 RepID=A0A7Y3RM64_9PROT|nr:carotenoid oxygenase family protein [Parvularcula mediterranea]NNU16649.1 apocarotenoid-15,15'-oxygenase [Parvularcula mediterranea]
MERLVRRVPSTLSESDHPYLNGAWTPNFDEYDAEEMEVIGEIPADLDGIYVRNTENPVHDAIGKYHPFDGDGMLHMMRFSGGKASYKNRFIRTRGFEAEQEAGRSLWIGFTGNPQKSERPGWGAHGYVKDSSSTDVLVHAGQILSTFWQCGEGYRLDPESLDTLGIEGWTPDDGISAHPKVDPKTGELLFFNYSLKAPYMHYGVVGADNQLKHYIPVELPGGRLPHDMAFSENFSILNDFPLFWAPEALENGYYVPVYKPELKSRFAILPRYGQPADIRWFEADPTYVLHYTNCYEEGDEIVLDGYFQNAPWPEPNERFDPKYRLLAAGIDYHSFKPHLHRWRFNLKTGETREEPLYKDHYVEFGTINPQYLMRKNRYVYSATAEPDWFLFNGLIKHDLETGATQRLHFGDKRFGSEAPFIPRKGATEEDDGYLVSFITDMNTDRSECVVLDARDIERGPLCRIFLPHRICSGTHAVWAGADELSA